VMIVPEVPADSSKMFINLCNCLTNGKHLGKQIFITRVFSP